MHRLLRRTHARPRNAGLDADAALPCVVLLLVASTLVSAWWQNRGLGIADFALHGALVAPAGVAALSRWSRGVASPVSVARVGPGVASGVRVGIWLPG